MIENIDGQMTGTCDFCGERLNVADLLEYPRFTEDNEPMLAEVTITFLHGEKTHKFLYRKGCFCQKCYNMMFKWKFAEET